MENRPAYGLIMVYSGKMTAFYKGQKYILEKGDIFVMSSDGINIDEIIQWMKVNENASSRKEVERFMELIQLKEREDDSTILLAKVN